MSDHLPTYKATRSRLSGEKKQNARDILLHEKARVLVTGAGGFIGSALVHALNQRGIQQIVVTDALGEDEKWRNLRPLTFEDYVPADEFLNGIEEIVTRPDLADRAVFLTLEPIPEKNRRPEAELWAEFKAQRPCLLGVLLDAVAEGIKRLPHTHLEQLPRMADFALWATACETALWPAGTFWSAYCTNRGEAAQSVLEADSIALLVRKLVDQRTVWTGTCADLLEELSSLLGDMSVRPKGWPDSPRKLSGRLRRAASPLRTVGIEIEFSREGSRTRNRIVTITSSNPLDMNGMELSRPSTPQVSDKNYLF
jgi:NAD(P)-dependent dehydrogenase (short-subunit alcohol dehydrogenase family)